MECIDTEVYEKWKANNTDEYSICIFRYAEVWSNAMEEALLCGYKLEDIANKMSHAADTEGITGNMYAMAVNILTKCWIYGEELRVWHNKEFGYEGIGVVNPSVLTFKPKEEEAK